MSCCDRYEDLNPHPNNSLHAPLQIAREEVDWINYDADEVAVKFQACRPYACLCASLVAFHWLPSILR